jgi:hypothetical protein
MLDLNHHLSMIATGERIARNVGGGSFTAILALLPLLLYSGHIFLGENDLRRMQEQSLERAIDGEFGVEALTLTIWILSLEEWEDVRDRCLRKVLKITCRKDTDNLFEKVKAGLCLFAVVSRIHGLVKGRSDVPVKHKENGSLTIGPHKGSKWIAGFMERLEKSGPECTHEFEELAEEIEDEIGAASDLRTALAYAGFTPGSAEEWVAAALGA